MVQFLKKHRDGIIITAVVIIVVGFVASLIFREIDAKKPDPNLSRKRIITVLSHVDAVDKNDDTYYDVVKIDGIDVLYLKVYDVSDRYMVPWLKPDGTPMTYNEYQGVWAW